MRRPTCIVKRVKSAAQGGLPARREGLSNRLRVLCKGYAIPTYPDAVYRVQYRSRRTGLDQAAWKPLAG